MVLGVVDPDDIASEEVARLLEDVKEDKIRKMQREYQDRQAKENYAK